MSEIFESLKQTELERRKRPSMAVNPDFASNFRTIELRASDAAEVDSKSLLPVSRALNEGSVFDLKAADYRLKSILESHGLVGEQYRMLRAKLSLMQKQGGVKTLLVTSTVQNEGKTLVACGLAAVLAQEPGRRVLLIDADLRKPDAYRNLGLLGGEDRFEGFSQVLRGEIDLEKALLASRGEELYFLPAGPVPPNPAELLSSRHLELALKTAAKLFDWVVIDSPPALSLADVSILAPHCDTALLVVHANSTPAKLIKTAIRTIGQDKFCGVVLNRVNGLMSSTYYYYYHHSHNLRRKK